MNTITERAIFFEKDGTLIEERPDDADLLTMRLLPRAAAGLARLRAAGYRLFVVSNQPGVARGLYRESELEPAVRRLEELLLPEEVALDGFYYCPHHPEGRVRGYAVACRCRKPSPGLIEDACREHDLDPLRSWMIGTEADDVEAGRRAGCRTVMIGRGHQAEARENGRRVLQLTAPDLSRAADLILARSEP